MYYDKKLAAAERDKRKEEAELQKLLEQVLEKKQKLRNVKGRLLATAKSDTWHAMTLTAEARRIGFTGEHGEALFYLRSLPLSEYVEAVNSYANEAPEASILSVEYNAVQANMAEWTVLGKHKHWERARKEYEAEVEGFQNWQAENPDKTNWRDKPATNSQYFLIWRTAEQLGIDQPINLKCGDAHDWLNKNDANLRFRSPRANKADQQADSPALPASVQDSLNHDGVNRPHYSSNPENSDG